MNYGILGHTLLCYLLYHDLCTLQLINIAYLYTCIFALV